MAERTANLKLNNKKSVKIISRSDKEDFLKRDQMNDNSHWVAKTLLTLSLKWKWKSLSRVQLFATPWTPWNSPGQNTGVGCHALLQGIFPTQGSNPGLLHCRQILYQLSHKGSPRILEWVAYPFSSGSSDTGIKLGSPALQVYSLPTELSGKPLRGVTRTALSFYCIQSVCLGGINWWRNWSSEELVVVVFSR